MAVGDRLVISLSTDRLAGRWETSSYPRAALRPDPKSLPAGAVGFVAYAAGSGRVLLTRHGCGTAGDQPCRGGPVNDASPLPPAAVWWVSVVVT
jgi:hypothetical protein